MWNKKEKQNDPDGPSQRGFDPPADEFGDTGAPINEIDPDALADARDEALAAPLRAELEEWKAKYARALADFQNYQRRSIENEKEAKRQGVTSVVSHLLGVLDNFDLALQQDPEKATAAQIMQGVSMVKQQMLHALGSLGVAVIAPSPGDEFDPHRHEAVAHMLAPGVEPGRVAACFQVGYLLGERVLRPAKTSIAKAEEQAGS